MTSESDEPYALPIGAIDRPRTAPGVSPALIAVGARFWERVRVIGDVDDPAACWAYLGQPSRAEKDRPPFFTIRSDTIPVARVAYELTGHGTTNGKTLSPTCGRMECCRPRHMRVKDYGRSTSYGRGVAEIAAGHRAACTPGEREETRYGRPVGHRTPPTPTAPVEETDPAAADFRDVVDSVRGGQLRRDATAALHALAEQLRATGAAGGTVLLEVRLARVHGALLVDGAVRIRPPRGGPSGAGAPPESQTLLFGLPP